MVSDDKDKNPSEESEFDRTELSIEDEDDIAPIQKSEAVSGGGDFEDVEDVEVLETEDVDAPFESSSDAPQDVISKESVSDFSDFDETPDDEFASASSHSEFDEIDVDVDITGDEEIDFGDDEELAAPKRRMMGAESGGVKKFLLPGLVLLGAACVGGYMILMPTVNNANISPAAVVIPPPPAEMTSANNDLSAPFEMDGADENVEVVAATDDFSSEQFEELPQPTVTQNVPSPPMNEGEPPLVDAVATLDTLDVNEDQPVMEDSQEPIEDNIEIVAQSDFDVAESNIMPSSPDGAEVDTFGEVPEEPLSSVSQDVDIANAGVDENAGGQEMDQPSADFPVLSEADFPPEPVRVAQNDITEPVEVQVVPEPVSEGLLPDDALSAPVEENVIVNDVSEDPLAAASGTSDEQVNMSDFAGDGPQAYFEAAPTRALPPTGAGASIGPRKIDPVVEPAAQYIIVNKTSQANDFEARLVAARRALNLERYDAARTLYAELVETNPRDPRVLMGLAVAQQKSGMTDVALQTYERLIDVDRNNPEALSNMLGLLRSQYPAVAARRLETLYQKNPSSPAIAAQLGIVNGELGNFDTAVKYLGIAASLQPENPLHFFNMAIISERARQTKDAIRYYERALEVDAVYGGGRSINRDVVYKRLSTLRRR